MVAWAVDACPLGASGKIVLTAAEGLNNHAIAARLSTGRECVADGVPRLSGIEQDAPRSGRKKAIPAENVREVIRLATTPAHAAHRSTRALAAAAGISFKSVHRILQSQELKPHLLRTFKVSNDPLFVEKVTHIVGLYLNSPERALVLGADEKSQIQALDRTQRSLPLKKGHARTATDGYCRHAESSPASAAT